MNSVLLFIFLLIYLLLNFGVLIVSLDNISVSTIINFALAIFSVIGGFGFLKRVSIFTSQVWAGLFYVVIVSTALSCLLQLMAGNLFVVVFVLILQLPMLLILKKYSNPDALYWFSKADLEKGAALESLFIENTVLILDSSTESVALSKVESDFKFQTSRNGELGKEEFEQKLSNSAALIKYVETYSNFKHKDFIDKYA